MFEYVDVDRVLGFDEADKLGRNDTALVQELVKRMLSVSTFFIQKRVQILFQQQKLLQKFRNKIQNFV